MPSVFLSYSHDSDAHKAWVRTLAEDLQHHGVDTTLDQWDLETGADLVSFMCDGIEHSDRVIMVCTAPYVTKANDGRGGVGYERLIISKTVYENTDTNKFIPIIRGMPPSLPVFMGQRVYIDFSEDSDYSARLEDLTRAIHEAPRHPKPPLGDNPYLGYGDVARTNQPTSPPADQLEYILSRTSVATATLHVRAPSIMSVGIQTHYWRLASPRRYFNQLLDLRRTALLKRKQAVASQIADAYRERGVLEERKQESAKWRRNMALAEQEGRTDLARASLERLHIVRFAELEQQRAVELLDGALLSAKVALNRESRLLEHIIHLAEHEAAIVDDRSPSASKLLFRRLGDLLACATWPNLPNEPGVAT